MIDPPITKTLRREKDMDKTESRAKALEQAVALMAALHRSTSLNMTKVDGTMPLETIESDTLELANNFDIFIQSGERVGLPRNG